MKNITKTTINAMKMIPIIENKKSSHSYQRDALYIIAVPLFKNLQNETENDEITRLRQEYKRRETTTMHPIFLQASFFENIYLALKIYINEKNITRQQLNQLDEETKRGLSVLAGYAIKDEETNERFITETIGKITERG